MTRSILIVLFVLAVAADAFSADVADYEKRVRSARAGIQDLLSNVASEEAGEEPTQPTNAVFSGVRELIPAREQIELSGAPIETNNQWFTDRLRTAEDEKDLTKRAEILNEIDERLAAMLVTLEKLDQATAAERAKDEDKQKLAEILNRPEYQKPVVEKEESESLMAKWIRGFLQWLEGWLPKTAGAPGPTGMGGAVTAVQYVLIGLIILLLGFLGYKLVPLFVPRFRRKEKEEKEDRVILGERIDEDINSADLFGEAERLAREGDLRGAIRKGYIALLCELSDRKIIGLARHKTNRDYLRDVRTKSETYEQMSGLTGSFERHWYGSQDAGAGDWEEFRRRCGETIKTI
jgi:hypothetical protein